MNPKFDCFEFAPHRHKTHSKYEETNDFLKRLKECMEERINFDTDGLFNEKISGEQITYNDEEDVSLISDMFINNASNNRSPYCLSYAELCEDKKRLFAIAQAQHVALLKMMDHINQLATQVHHLSSEISHCKTDIHHHFHAFLDHRDIEHKNLPDLGSDME